MAVKEAVAGLPLHEGYSMKLRSIYFFDRGISVSLDPETMGDGEIVSAVLGLSKVITDLAEVLDRRYSDAFRDAYRPALERSEWQEEV